MPKYTREDIVRMVKENDVKFIRLQFTDIFGRLKNVAITDSQIEKCLNNECMFDGSSIEGFVRIEESDMYLYPDLDTFVILPWMPQSERVARLICDVYTADREPFAGDPRYILKKAAKEASDMGYTLNVGPELEFFLFHIDDVGRPTTISHDTGGYFDMAPFDLGGNARREICLTLQEMGFEIEASHHEVAPAQHEIDFKYGDALTAADNMVTFKMVVKTIAKRKGLYATFMPKPIYGVAGSGMHVNMSLCDKATGKNVFCNSDSGDGLSDTAHSFIAGLLDHVKGMIAFTNPIVNSYKRLVPGFEAPCYIAWSTSNRSPLIRVPSSRGAGTRCELRCPDSACNPYLALAACLTAGLDGIRRGLTPPPSTDQNVYDMTEEERQAAGIETLPNSLEKAIAEFKKDELIKNAIGSHITSKYIKAKSAEWNAYTTAVTEWEINEYLAKY